MITVGTWQKQEQAERYDLLIFPKYLVPTNVIPQLCSGAIGPGAAYSFLAFQYGDFI